MITLLMIIDTPVLNNKIMAMMLMMMIDTPVQKNAVWEGCSSVSYKCTDGWDGTLGEVKYRAAYAATENMNVMILMMIINTPVLKN